MTMLASYVLTFLKTFLLNILCRDKQEILPCTFYYFASSYLPAFLCLLLRILRAMITKTIIIMAKATTATTTPITIIITIMSPLLLPFEPGEDTAESTLKLCIKHI